MASARAGRGFTYGGSTGGWEAMATQVFYPDMYNGAFIACPDPIDFHAYTTINLYQDRNAFAAPGVAQDIDRPAMRDYLGQTLATQRDENHMELALGDRSRSGGQYDIWQAVFGPEGADGYPKPIFDKQTGVIDPSVVAYWREHYDLTHIVARDWASLGPKLKGQAAHLRRLCGQLFPERRGLFRARQAGEPARSGLGRGGGLWRARRALLERRPDARQRLLPASTTTCSTCRKSWRGSRPPRGGRGGRDELAVLRGGAGSAQPGCALPALFFFFEYSSVSDPPEARRTFLRDAPRPDASSRPSRGRRVKAEERSVP